MVGPKDSGTVARKGEGVGVRVPPTDCDGPAIHPMTKEQLIKQVALAMCNQHSRVPIHEPCGTHLSAAEHLYNLGYLLEVKG